MAEIVGLVASLITLAGATAKLAETLLKAVNILQSAQMEARYIAMDISTLSSTLTQLSQVLEISHSKTDKLREITAVLIVACKTLIEDLTELIGDPGPYNAAQRRIMMPYLKLRFRWVMNGPKVTFLKSLVDSFKTTTILLVSTMNLATAHQRGAPDSIR